jgi:hypothetical protein
MDGKALQYVLQPFHTFFVQFDATMTHNILVFMLDLKYKGLVCDKPNWEGQSSSFSGGV